MASVVSICNLALFNIAKPDIQALDEDSAGAKACNAFYEQCRDTLLQSYVWRFARQSLALAEITNSKPNRWGYAYQRPSECLKLIRVTDELALDYMVSDGLLTVGGGLAYALEGSAVFCNSAPAYLDCIVRVTDTTLYPPLFVEALSWQLAVKLAMPLTRDPKIRADAYQLAERMTAAAGVADANEVREVDDAPSQAIEAR